MELVLFFWPHTKSQPLSHDLDVFEKSEILKQKVYRPRPGEMSKAKKKRAFRFVVSCQNA